MNNEDIINILRKYNFDKDKYLVISGAALVLLGIKDKTSDIDIAVTKDYYKYLLENYECTFDRCNEYGNDCYFIDGIINFGIDYYSKNNILIDDIPIQNINDILDLKKKLNREKDKEIIEKIEKYIKENNE